MNSLILSTATRYLLPLLLIFSVFLLLRGHNDPVAALWEGWWRRRRWPFMDWQRA
jgi:multisubunit Na+/H+ antiporter MnhB subunit